MIISTLIFIYIVNGYTRMLNMCMNKRNVVKKHSLGREKLLFFIFFIISDPTSFYFSCEYPHTQKNKVNPTITTTSKSKSIHLLLQLFSVVLFSCVNKMMIAAHSLTMTVHLGDDCKKRGKTQQIRFVTVEID